MRAAESHRPLLIVVTAQWDVTSRALEDRMLADPSFVGASRGAIALRIDVTDTEGPNQLIAEELGVTAVPTVLVFAPGGRESFRSVGSSVDLVKLIEALGAP